MCIYQPISFPIFFPFQACQGIYIRKGLPRHNSVPSGGRCQQEPRGNQGIQVPLSRQVPWVHFGMLPRVQPQGRDHRSNANRGFTVLLPCRHSGDLCRPASGHQVHPNWLRVSCLLHLPIQNGRTFPAFSKNADRRKHARPPEVASRVQRPTQRRWCKWAGQEIRAETRRPTGLVVTLVQPRMPPRLCKWLGIRSWCGAGQRVPMHASGYTIGSIYVTRSAFKSYFYLINVILF